MSKKIEDPEIQVIARNKRAFHDYEVMDRLEAGLVLTGTEVKSLRAGHVSIAEAYVRVVGGKPKVFHMDILPYKFGNLQNHEPKRVRVLLLHKREIDRLVGQTSIKGFTVVPLALYFKRGFAKLEIAVARGKTHGDKREALKKKEADRSIRKAMSRKG